MPDQLWQSCEGGWATRLCLAGVSYPWPQAYAWRVDRIRGHMLMLGEWIVSVATCLRLASGSCPWPHVYAWRVDRVRGYMFMLGEWIRVRGCKFMLGE